MKKLDLRTLFAIAFLICLVGGLSYILTSQPTYNPKETPPRKSQPTPSKRSKVTKTQTFTFQLSLVDESGRGIQHATVTIRSTTNSILKESKTDEHGWLELSSLPYNPIKAAIAHPDYFKEQLNVKPQSNTEYITTTLVKKRRIVGKVFDENDSPIANAAIHIIDASPSIQSYQDYLNKKDLLHSSNFSNSTGDFKLYPLLSGTYKIQVTHPEFLMHTESCQAGDQLNIRLRKTALLTVTVENDRGEPIGGAPVKVQSSSETLTVLEDETNIHGRVRFDQLKADVYNVEALSPYNKVRAATDVDLTVVDQATVELIFQSPVFSLSGHVLDAVSKQGIANVTVCCKSEIFFGTKRVSETCITNHEGYFIFNDLTPGNYTLYVEEIKGYMSGDFGAHRTYGAAEPMRLSHTLDENVDNIEIYLKPSWIITGRVLDEKGNGLKGAKVSLQLFFKSDISVGYVGSTSVGTSSFSGADGSYELDGPFEYDNVNASVYVRADHPRYGNEESEMVNPEPGDAIEGLDIQYENAWNVYGRVHDRQGSGIEDAYVFLYYPPVGNRGVDLIGRTMSYGNGEFALYVKPGTYTTHAQAKGYHDPNENKQQIKVPKQGKIEINYVLEEGGNVISGRVQSTDGQPVVDADILLSQKERGEDRYSNLSDTIATTDINGAFSFDPAIKTHRPALDPLYQLTIMPNDKYKEKIVNDVEAGQNDLLITLENQNDQSFEIFGHARDVNNRPVTEFRLLFVENLAIRHGDRYMPDPNDFMKGWTYFNSPNGEFHVKGNEAPDYPLTIAIHNPEYGIAFSRPFDIAPGQVIRDMRIEFKGNVSISGKVVDKENGNPLPDTEVSLLVETSTMEDVEIFQFTGFGVRMTRGVQGWLQRYLPKTKTDENGVFQLHGVPNDTLWIVFKNLSDYKISFMRLIETFGGNQIDLGTVALPRYDHSQRRQFTAILPTKQ